MRRQDRPLALVVAVCSLLAWPGLARSEPSRTKDAGDAVATEKRVDLFIGEQTVIPADGVDKYSEGIPGIVDIRLPADASNFVVVARSAGTTTMLLLMRDGTRVRYTFVVRRVRVSERDNIRLDFYFVQLSQNDQLRFGIGWPGTLGGTASLAYRADLQTSTTTSATLSVVSQVLPRLDFGQDRGWAKIVREASVVMANGEQSSFKSGGELNFRIESAVSSSIQPISFGSTIEVQPRYDRTTGRIDVTIVANVAELTQASTEGLPGRSTTSLKTTVNLALGQSIVLAGIHAKSEGSQRDGLAFLSQIPVLGYLFGSRQTSSNESENLIFIVPSILQAVPMEERDRVTEALAAYRHAEDYGDDDRIYRMGFPRHVTGNAPASTRSTNRDERR